MERRTCIVVRGTKRPIFQLLLNRKPKGTLPPRPTVGAILDNMAFIVKNLGAVMKQFDH